MCSFENNLGRLLDLRKEASGLIQLCQESIQEQSNQLRNQFVETQKREEEILQLREQSTELQDHYEQQRIVQCQREESLRGEIKLLDYQYEKERELKSNEMYGIPEYYNRQEMRNIIGQLQQKMSDLEEQQRREMENVKLMHSQELYMLRKKK